MRTKAVMDTSAIDEQAVLSAGCGGEQPPVERYKLQDKLRRAEKGHGSIYRRRDSDRYYFKIPIPGGFISGPCGTTDKEAARQVKNQKLSEREQMFDAVAVEAALEALREARLFTGSHRVYFIESGDTGLVKIGVTADIARRMTAMQGGTPHPLQLRVCVPGGRVTEAVFHAAFLRQHYRGEWFYMNHTIRQFISKARTWPMCQRAMQDAGFTDF